MLCNSGEGLILDLDTLHHPAAAGIPGYTGDECDAVIRSGIQVAPVIVLNGGNCLYSVGPFTDRSLIDDFIAALQILDGADLILGAPVMVE